MSIDKMKQFDYLISQWYKTFGIDNVFHEINFKSFELNSQEQIAKKDFIQQFEINSDLNFKTIDELKNAVFNDINLSIKKSARNTVFGDGAIDAKIMIIGEAPGQEEDEQGKPFVGQSGQLLNRMLESVDLQRSDVYITNIVFWRPPGNRNPSTEEISLCLPYVFNHIKLINPKVIVLLGGVAVKTLLNCNESITYLRGRPVSILGIPAIPTFHPAYLLRSPSQKSAAFKDFILLKKISGEKSQ